MKTVLKPWQFNLITCCIYLLFAIFTMQALQTLSTWPPAGVALAAVTLFGRKAWLGVAAGSILSVFYHFYLNNLDPFSFNHLVINLATSTGNTLAALCAFNIMYKQIVLHNPLKRVENVAGTFIFACAAMGMVSAIFGVGIYYVLGLEWFDGLFFGVLNWSISNALAAIAISPALYFLWRRWPHKMTFQNVTQSLLITAITVLCCYLIFGPGYTHFDLPILQPSLLLFPLLYCAMRLSSTLTSCMNMLVFCLAWIGSNQGWGYFYQHHAASAEITLQFFFLFIFAVVLLVQAVFNQRQDEQEELTRLLEQRVEERTCQLEYQKQKALKLAVTDPLTELYNRRGFFKTAHHLFSQYLRHPGSCALLLLDLDKFKLINDNYGHAMGDEVIKNTADILRHFTRESDITGRIGGEEFVVFLPMSTQDDATSLAERIRQAISEQQVTLDNVTVQYTLSIGVSTFDQNDKTLETMLKRADKALYIAKNQGRNQVQYC